MKKEVATKKNTPNTKTTIQNLSEAEQQKIEARKKRFGLKYFCLLSILFFSCCLVLRLLRLLDVGGSKK